MNESLPAADCIYGYTDAQLDLILGDRRDEFNHWMRGQTIAGCDGRSFNHMTREYEPSGCGPHGFVTYAHDLKRFLAGLPVID